MKQKNLVIAGGLTLFTFLIYWLFYGGEVKYLNYFTPLADAFLQGRLYLTEPPDWLNELIEVQGKYFVVYPPMPAILLIPFVALFGKGFEQPLFSILIGAVNVGLCYLVVLKIFKKPLTAFLSAILFGFGTMQWYHAQAGSAWYISHIIAIFFIWLMILETLTGKRYLLIGFLIGAAYWSRLPAILAIVFPIIFYHEDFFQKELNKDLIKNWLFIGSGIGFFVVLNGLYNFLRFGVPWDISYSLIPVFNEPWYRYGLFDIRYIPIHLEEIFSATPKIISQLPFVTPSLFVMALWVVTPAFLLLPLADWRKRIVVVSALTVLIIALPGLMHGSNGFSQFGFRFALDYHPFLLLIIASVLKKGWMWLCGFLIGLSILINFWGVLMISHFNTWTM